MRVARFLASRGQSPASDSQPMGAVVRAPVLGLRANLSQFLLLVLINAFVGAMVGLERSVLPLLGEQTFALASTTATLSFIASFGIVKAVANLFAGRLSDRIGRKGVLIAGWLVALPVPLLIIAAPNWGWIVFANVLLGVNQGLCWSTTVIMKIDLVGPARRGLAMGFNEAAGYGAVSLAAILAGYLAAMYGLRPAPFLPGIGFAVAGLLLTVLCVHESQGHARHEARLTRPAQVEPARGAHQIPAPNAPAPADERLTTLPAFWDIFIFTTWKNRALFAVSQAGLVNNLNDGVAWGLFPLFFAAGGLGIGQIGLLAGIYPGVWSVTQLATGALSDRLGRKRLIVGGMWLQALAIALVPFTHGFVIWALLVALLGVGTALVYPTLLAAVADVAHPSWRASSVGVYRLWRDSGYAFGALLAGVLADRFNIPWAIVCVAALTFGSGCLALMRMYETLPSRGVDRAAATQSAQTNG
jgi:MFS family permease